MEGSCSNLILSSNISNNNNNSKSSFKTATTTTNDTDNIVNNLDDDDDNDDIIIIDFDENANLSSASSPLTQSNENNSRSSSFGRTRLKSTSSKDELNFSNFDESKHASSSSSFRRLFGNSMSNSEVITESSINLDPNQEQHNPMQTNKVIDMNTTTSIQFNDKISESSDSLSQHHSKLIGLNTPSSVTITFNTLDTLNGIRYSSNIKESSSNFSNCLPTRTSDIATAITTDTVSDVPPAKETMSSVISQKSSSFTNPNSNTKTETEALSDNNLNSNSRIFQSDLSTLPIIPSENRIQLKEFRNSSKAFDFRNSAEKLVERDNLHNDSLSPCSLVDFSSTEPNQIPSNELPIFGAQRVFNAVPTFNDPMLKYRSVSPYFEQEHQKEQLSKLTSECSKTNQEVTECDSIDLNKANIFETSKPIELVPVTSEKNQKSSSSETISNSMSVPEPIDNFNVLTQNITSESFDQIEQIPSTSSNDCFGATTLIDSGIASPADEVVNKEILNNTPTSIINECITDNKVVDNKLESSENVLSKEQIELPLCSTENLDIIPTPACDEQTINQDALIEIPNKCEESTISEPLKALSKYHSLSDDEHDFSTFKTGKFNKFQRCNSLYTGDEQFLDGLYCEPIGKRVSRKFTAKRVNGFKNENAIIFNISAESTNVRNLLNLKSIATEKTADKTDIKLDDEISSTIQGKLLENSDSLAIKQFSSSPQISPIANIPIETAEKSEEVKQSEIVPETSSKSKDEDKPVSIMSTEVQIDIETKPIEIQREEILKPILDEREVVLNDIETDHLKTSTKTLESHTNSTENIVSNQSIDIVEHSIEISIEENSDEMHDQNDIIIEQSISPPESVLLLEEIDLEKTETDEEPKELLPTPELQIVLTNETTNNSACDENNKINSGDVPIVAKEITDSNEKENELLAKDIDLLHTETDEEQKELQPPPELQIALTNETTINSACDESNKINDGDVLIVAEEESDSNEKESELPVKNIDLLPTETDEQQKDLQPSPELQIELTNEIKIIAASDEDYKINSEDVPIITKDVADSNNEIILPVDESKELEPVEQSEAICTPIEKEIIKEISDPEPIQIEQMPIVEEASVVEKIVTDSEILETAEAQVLEAVTESREQLTIIPTNDNQEFELKESSELLKDSLPEENLLQENLITDISRLPKDSLEAENLVNETLIPDISQLPEDSLTKKNLLQENLTTEISRLPKESLEADNLIKENLVQETETLPQSDSIIKDTILTENSILEEIQIQDSKTSSEQIKEVQKQTNEEPMVQYNAELQKSLEVNNTTEVENRSIDTVQETIIQPECTIEVEVLNLEDVQNISEAQTRPESPLNLVLPKINRDFVKNQSLSCISISPPIEDDIQKDKLLENKSTTDETRATKELAKQNGVILKSTTPEIESVQVNFERKISHRSAGRRTKPTKTLKLNNLNDLSLKEIYDKSDDSTLIDNLNVLVEVALADQIKNMTGFSVTVKSIEPIDKIKPIDHISPIKPVKAVLDKSINIEEQKLDIQQIEETTKNRSTKTGKNSDNYVRKSARITTAKQAKENSFAEQKTAGTKKGKKNDAIDTAAEVNRALEKMKKMTEKKKATIFRAVDTIKEISPFKEEQPIVEVKKTKCAETYVQKPVREKAIKSPKFKTNLRNQENKIVNIEKRTIPSEKRNERKPIHVEKKKLDHEKNTICAEKTEIEVMRGPEILTALNLVERKNTAKRTCIDLEIAALLSMDSVTTKTDNNSSNQNKKIKTMEATTEQNSIPIVSPILNVRPNGIDSSNLLNTEMPTALATPKIDEVLRSNDSSPSLNKTHSMSPIKESKVNLPNGHTIDTTPNKKLENDENKYMSPLVMKKTYECKCNSDRDRILKRIKEFNNKFPSLGREEDVVALITESIPNVYMETRTTLIKIKKIFFQRFVNMMQQTNLGIPTYLVKINETLLHLSQIISFDNEVFDDIFDWYNAMKDEMKVKNMHTTLSIQHCKNFDKFLKWWSRKFKCYCSDNTQTKKCSRNFYDTEESISSDSNSQEKDYSPSIDSPKKQKKYEDISSMLNRSPTTRIIPDFTVPKEMPESMDVEAVANKPVLELPSCITLEDESNSSEHSMISPVTLPPVELEPLIPINADTIISFPNFVSDSTDIEITHTNSNSSCNNNNNNNNNDSTTKTSSPIYESEDSLLMLPLDSSNTSDTMNFPDQLRQLLLDSNKIDDVPSEIHFDQKNATASIYDEDAITIPLLTDSNNDALVSSAPQKINEIMLQNEIDNYGDDNKIFDNIFGDFTREYVHRTDPTMGTSKKGYSERPLPVEEAVFQLVDNDLTRISSLSNGHNICAPLKEILDPSRIPKKDNNRTSLSDDLYDNSHLNQSHTNGVNNENIYENSMSTQLMDMMSYNQNLSEYNDDYEVDLFYLDMLMTNGTQNNMVSNENNTLMTNNTIASGDSRKEINSNSENTDQVVETVSKSEQNQFQENENQALNDNQIMNHDDDTAQMNYEQTKITFDDIIEYDPEVSTNERCEEMIEQMDFLKSDYDLKALLPNNPDSLKVQSNTDFSFKEPPPYTNGPITKAHSSKLSFETKSQKLKRKHHQNDESAIGPSKKLYKSDEIKDTLSLHSSNASNNHHKKQPQTIPTYIVKNISYIKPSSPSLTFRSNTTDNGLKTESKSMKHHNGTDKNSNSTTEPNVPKIIKIKIKNLPTEDPSKASSRRDGKKYNVASTKLYTTNIDESLSKKSHHSNNRKNSGNSSRGLSKSNQHWRTQVHYN